MMKALIEREFKQFHFQWPMLLAILVSFCMANTVLSQDRQGYLPGQGNTVEIIVHIIGEVKNPGKYQVRDNTNLIELLSEAGGSTDFSNLNDVTITHTQSTMANGRNGGGHNGGSRIIKYNVNKYLKEQNSPSPPTLLPGDVVLVPRNKWRTWRNVATIVRDVSVVASAYFLYLRANR